MKGGARWLPRFARGCGPGTVPTILAKWLVPFQLPRLASGLAPNLIRSGAYSVINRSPSGSGLAEIRSNKLERHQARGVSDRHQIKWKTFLKERRYGRFQMDGSFRVCSRREPGSGGRDASGPEIGRGVEGRCKRTAE